MDPALRTASFINLVTFRKDGREVPTPVWFAELDGKLYSYTLSEAGKLKRIRANGKVKVAPCDMRGKVQGSWSAGSGRIVEDPAHLKRIYAAFPAKYGWQYWVGTLFSRLSGKFPRRVMVELSV